MKKKFIGISILVLGLFLSYSVTGQDNSLVVFLVRHAEKVDNGRDPELSEAGKLRAQDLAETLKSAQLKYVHSTDYKRTMETAKPTSKLIQSNIEIYNPGALQDLVEKLKKTGGRHLVVGHSNTTPALVELLGGEPGTPIVEKNEYDRLYILTIPKDGQVSTVLMRYGDKFAGDK